MFREFFRFDLRLHAVSPLAWATVILFGVMGLFSTKMIGLGGALANVSQNAPMAVLQMTGILNLFSMFFVTLFVAQPLLRDHEQGVADLYFSKPMSKAGYLFGRMAAGIAASLFLNALMIALMALGMHVGIGEAGRIAPFSLTTYVTAFAVVALPNLLFMAGLMALLATSSRSIIMVYVGIVIMLALWGSSQTMLANEDGRTLASMLDPFAVSTLNNVGRYWVPAELNARVPELSGVLLMNRLLFAGLGLAMMVLAVVSFKTVRTGTGKPWWRRRSAAPAAHSASIGAVPPRRRFTPATGIRVAFYQFFHLARFDLAAMVRSGAFLCFMLLAMLQYLANLNGNISFMNTPQYATTSWAVDIASRGLGLFLLIIIVFYAGELFHKERSAKMHEVTSACPTPDLLALLAKCAALVAAVVIYLVAVAATGIVFQLMHNYDNIRPGLFLGALLVESLPYVSFALVAIALQVFTQNKYAGYMFAMMALALRMGASSIGLDDGLLQFGRGPELMLSDMDGYGNNLTSYLLFQAYWLCFSIALLVLAASTSVRGAPLRLRQRLAQCGPALRGASGAALGVVLLAMAGAGATIFTNTHVRNHYTDKDKALDLQQAYEKEYGPTATMAEPKITGLDVALDMSPSAHTLSYKARYDVVNPHATPIGEVQLLVNRELVLADPAFGKVVRRDARFNIVVVQLDQPLAPGARATWELDLRQRPRSFTNTGDRNMVLANGTFLHSYRLLPSFGYNRSGIIKSPIERAKRGLPPLPGMAPASNLAARAVPFNSDSTVDASDDADTITFNTVVSTDADQLALAPGKLQREWQDHGRRYFHYKMEGKMDFYAAWLSGKWEHKQGSWHGKPIDVYYDRQHGYNVDRIISTTQAALEYFSKAYSPYQHDQLRIVEFPRTMGQFAESFSGTVPFSESASFIADVRDKGSFDQVSYVTAHEVAHQWWGHQLAPANVQGATMVGESLAQYSSLMVVRQQIGKEAMRPFLRQELDSYLVGRGSDRKGERPLVTVEDQMYIFYSKGSLAFYRLAEEIGEDAVNRALAKFLAASRQNGALYATAPELLQFIRAEAGAQHEQLIADLFEKITLYDNRVSDAHAKRLADGRYEVSMTLNAAKIYADAKGKESPAVLDDWIDVGVFGKGDKVLKLERRHVTGTGTHERVSYIVDEKPVEVGFDPYNKLIDRLSGDNRIKPAFD